MPWQFCKRAAFALAVLVIPSAFAAAQTTALYFDSQPGESVGQGRQQTWTPSATTLFRVWNNGRGTVHVDVDGVGFWWDLTFAAPTGTDLSNGTYEYATAIAFGAVVGTMEISGSGVGCTANGRFQVHEVAFDAAGALTRLAVDFEQHCSDATPALFGAVRFNSTRASLDPFGGAYPVYSLHVDQDANGVVTTTGIDCGSGHVDCDESFATATTISIQAVPNPGYVFAGWIGDCHGLNPVALVISTRRECTAVFNVESGGSGVESPSHADGALRIHSPTGSYMAPDTEQVLTAARTLFSVTAASSQYVGFVLNGPRNTRWALQFGAASGGTLAPGLFEYATSDSSRAVPYFSLGGPSAYGCSAGARFQIYEITFSGAALTTFAADFEVPCGPDNQIIAGAIRFHATRSSLLPFDGAYPTYSLHVVPSVGGYVSSAGIDCGTGRVDCDELYGTAGPVTLQAAPASGYEFLVWGGSCRGAALTTVVTVDAARRCFAVFNPTPGGGEPADSSLAAGALFYDMPGATSGPDRKLWAPGDAGFRISYGYGSSVWFDVTSSFSDWTTITFGVPGGIVPGVYEESYSLGALTSTLDIFDCTERAGRFVVYEATFDASGKVLTFAADFEVYCAEPARPYIAGALRYHAARGNLLPFDGAYPVYRLTVDPAINGVVSAAGIDCGAGGHTDCSETYASPTTVTLQAQPASGYLFVGWTGVCDGGATIAVSVSWIKRCAAIFNAIGPGGGVEDPRLAARSLTIDSSPGEIIGAGRRHVFVDTVVAVAPDYTRNRVSAFVTVPDGRLWTFSFRAPNTGDLQVGTLYTNVVWDEGLTHPTAAMSITSPYGLCSSVSGRFVIHELTFSSTGAVTAFAVDFEHACSTTGPKLRGSLRFQSTRSAIVPFGPVPPGEAGEDAIPLSPAPGADGKLDIVWQHDAAGALAAWDMNGATMQDSAWLAPSSAGSAWKVRAVGDLNRDNQPDLIWQHDDGWVAVWFMNGTAAQDTRMLSIPRVTDPDWIIVGSADMNGDRRADILWQHRTRGSIAVWLMWDNTVLDTRMIASVNPAWRVAGVGDLNRDDRPDLVFQRSSGELAVWFMNGFTVLDTRMIATLGDPAWRVRGVRDMNDDWRGDLVFRHDTSGLIATWFMWDNAVLDTRWITPSQVADLHWAIAGVR